MVTCGIDGEKNGVGMGDRGALVQSVPHTGPTGRGSASSNLSDSIFERPKLKIFVLKLEFWPKQKL